MDELNYRHLHYFWVVTQEGSVTRASQKLNVAQPTISAQLKKFEQTLGARLFRRAGRTLELTETGRKVRRYAEQIFALGDDLLRDLQGRTTPRSQPLSVGIAQNIPAALVEPLLSVAMQASDAGSLSIHSGSTCELIAALAGQRVDLVLATEAGESHTAIRTHSRLLIEAPVVLAGTEEVAARFRRGFPGSLQAAPIVLPSADNPLRLAIDRWLVQHRLQPQIVLETDNEAWQRRWGLSGRALVATIKPRPGEPWHVAGRLNGVKLACYGITLSRQSGHPTVRALLSAS